MIYQIKKVKANNVRASDRVEIRSAILKEVSDPVNI